MRVLLMMPIDLYQGWPLANDTIRHHQILPGYAFPQLAAMIPDHSVEIYDGLGMSLKKRVDKKFLIEYLPRFDVIGLNVVSELVSLNTEINIRMIRRARLTIFPGMADPLLARKKVGRNGSMILIFSALVKKEQIRTFPIFSGLNVT